MMMNIPGNTGNTWRKTPVQRLVVGLTTAGLLPFILLLPLINQGPGLLVFKGYSLAILAFLCGSWWSTVLITPRLSVGHRLQIIVVSNLLVLLSIGVLMTGLASKVALVIQGGLFLLLLTTERYHPAFIRQPAYYRQLRLVVSLGVAFTHLIAGYLVTY